MTARYHIAPRGASLINKKSGIHLYLAAEVTARNE
jgi:hypothetical protein